MPSPIHRTLKRKRSNNLKTPKKGSNSYRNLKPLLDNDIPVQRHNKKKKRYNPLIRTYRLNRKNTPNNIKRRLFMNVETPTAPHKPRRYHLPNEHYEGYYNDPNIQNENLEDLKELNLNTNEWKIHVGNQANEYIPRNLRALPKKGFKLGAPPGVRI
jgi:hypothetical protein